MRKISYPPLCAPYVPSRVVEPWMFGMIALCLFVCFCVFWVFSQFFFFVYRSGILGRTKHFGPTLTENEIASYYASTKLRRQIFFSCKSEKKNQIFCLCFVVQCTHQCHKPPSQQNMVKIVKYHVLAKFLANQHYFKNIQ